MASPNVTVTDTAAQWTQEIQRQIDAELADPSGSRVLVAEIATGDLSTPDAKAALTAGLQAVLAEVPGHGG
jgi:hypothetical protein